MTWISVALLAACALPLAYLLLLAASSVRGPTFPGSRDPVRRHRFVIAIAAHDEEPVIAETVRRLRRLDYPADLFEIHVVADHCSDDTAAQARDAGAIVHERDEGPRSGKGQALSWLFPRVLGDDCDAVVIVDADTQIHPDFLRVIDVRLAEGYQAIQGQHVISNPGSGWFPALVWAMFLIDNRFQNLGRCRLGWSAKNMGDSICFRADVLRRLGWGEGLTEDYDLRQRLLLDRIRIFYEPAAIGCGEAPLTWAQAGAQRTRWLRGAYDVGQQFARRLFVEAIQRRDPALLDAALQSYLPSYSTLTLFCAAALGAHAAIDWLAGPLFPPWLLSAWALTTVALFAYPLTGLALERAPVKAYAAILLGPFFMVWRTWLLVAARFGGKQVIWVRTAHGRQK